MLERKSWRVIAELCALAMAALWALPGQAQMAEVKEKPPMYSYVSFWTFPRGQWAERAKENAADRAILGKALSSGAIVGYGDDVNLIHQPDGEHARRLVVGYVHGRGAQCVGPVLQVRLDHFSAAGQRHRPLG